MQTPRETGVWLGCAGWIEDAEARGRELCQEVLEAAWACKGDESQASGISSGNERNRYNNYLGRVSMSLSLKEAQSEEVAWLTNLFPSIG